MSDNWLSISDIVLLMEAFNKNHMGTLKLKNGDQSIVLKSQACQTAAAPAGTAPMQTAPQPVQIRRDEDEIALPGNVVKSPIVGTFYAAPAPERPAFTQVGQQVKKGDVLFIIESMKLMNEVISELDGTVTHILAEDGQPVEYGQPILCIE